MSEKKKYSIIIRVACGLLGSFGIAVPFAIFHALKAGNFSSVFGLIGCLYVFYIFLYVAITGTDPFKIKTEITKNESLNPAVSFLEQVITFFGKSAAIIIIGVFLVFIIFCIFIVLPGL